jgi:hypothetical protein
MTGSPALVTPSRLRTAALAVAVVLAVVVATVWRSPASGAAPSPDAGPAAAWLATKVNPDGSVDNPFGGAPSVVWAANVALSLSATGTQPAALQSALGYVQTHVESYIVDLGSDSAGRLGFLLLLADANDLDPHAFGTPAVDLVARLQALYEQTEPGLYDAPDVYSSGVNQSLAVLGLTAVGEPVPAGAVDWLIDQQCLAGEGPAGVEGGWQGYRAPSGGGLEDCVVLGAPDYISPDTSNTSYAVQALAAVGRLGELGADPNVFFASLQGASGPAAGGFGFGMIGTLMIDPGSTAVVIQALLAQGEDLSTWAVGGGDPMSSLESWVIASGPDAGALSSSSSSGGSDMFATYQGVWGLAEQPFPFEAPAPVPPTTTTTSAPVPDDGGAAPAVEATPAFTG